MNKKIRKSGRILILLLLLSMLLPTVASALNINGIGSGIAAAGSTSGTGGYSIPYTMQAIGYRFALVDSSGNKVSGTDVADVYRSGDVWKLSGNTVNHLYIRRTKQEWITMANKIRNGSQTVKGNFYFVALSGSSWNADKLGTGDTYTDSNWGLSLPANAADMPGWITPTNVETIITKAWGKSYSNFVSNKWVLQAEPIYMIMVAKEYLVGTIPEFAFIAVADGTFFTLSIGNKEKGKS